MGNCAALVAINSMKEQINQQINSKNAKRHEYGRPHGSLNRTGASLAAASLKIRAKVLRSPENFIRSSSRKLASGKNLPFIFS